MRVPASLFHNCKAIGSSFLRRQISSQASHSSNFVSHCTSQTVPAIQHLTLPKNFSSHSNPPHSQNQNDNVRFFPNYVVYKDNASFSLKFVPPQFKRNNQNINVGKKGKIVFEVAPRGEGTMTDWFNAINIALSVEELGVFLSNISNLKETSFSHTSMQGDTKTISMVPNEDGSSCKIILNAEGKPENEECVLNEGELEVVKNIILSTIPNLVAWNTLIEQSITSLVGRENYSDPFADRNDFRGNDIF